MTEDNWRAVGPRTYDSRQQDREIRIVHAGDEKRVIVRKRVSGPLDQ
jgi:hypothetical protein